MLPVAFLALLLALTLAAWVIDGARRRRRSCILRARAAAWGMQFVPEDRFGLVARVAAVFPVPGIANLRVRDVMYLVEGDRHRFLFTAEYTQGVLRHQDRIRRAVAFCEPAARNAADTPACVALAGRDLPLAEQYQALRDRPAGSAAAAVPASS